MLHDLLVAIALGLRQLDARQAEIAQCIVDDLLLRGVQLLVLPAIGNLAKGPVQALVLAQLGTVFAQQRKAGVVGITQFIRVDNGIHVADR